ncbi:MAG: hypothetical protein ACXVH7_06920 [Thermoanaerobaculia bacterium]
MVNVETSHEKSDVDVRALLWFFVIFVVFSVLTFFGLWVMFKVLIRVERRAPTSPLTSMAQPADMNVPAEPRLQPFPKKAEGVVAPPNRSTPVIDMVDMRAAEDRILNNYGWVDQSKGVVRIPIEEAKKRVLQQLQQGSAAAPGGQR